MLDDDAAQITDHLVDRAYLDHDTDMLFIGVAAEMAYGRRHFMDLVSVFTSEPEFTVIAGTRDIGTVDPLVLTAKIDGPRRISLAGQTWTVTHISFKRKRCWVEPADGPAKMQWTSSRNRSRTRCARPVVA
jgi:ATP-dependent Lhr-like helicase